MDEVNKARQSLYQVGATNYTPTIPAPVSGTAPSTQPSAGTPSAPTTLNPGSLSGNMYTTGTPSSAPTTLNPGSLSGNMYTTGTSSAITSGVMPVPSAYQSGLYRHMIWKLLQQDDPSLLIQMHKRIEPDDLAEGVFYLQNDERDALSAPQTAAFFDNQKRMDQVLDDLAAWMKELARRQRARGPVAARMGAFVRKMDRNGSLILAIVLLLVAACGFVYLRNQRKRE